MTRIDDGLRYLVNIVNNIYGVGTLKIVNMCSDSYTLNYQGKTRLFKSCEYCNMFNIISGLIPQGE